jgi:hypothetical protein
MRRRVWPCLPAACTGGGGRGPRHARAGRAPHPGSPTCLPARRCGDSAALPCRTLFGAPRIFGAAFTTHLPQRHHTATGRPAIPASAAAPEGPGKRRRPAVTPYDHPKDRPRPPAPQNPKTPPEVRVGATDCVMYVVVATLPGPEGLERDGPGLLGQLVSGRGCGCEPAWEGPSPAVAGPASLARSRGVP